MNPSQTVLLCLCIVSSLVSIGSGLDQPYSHQQIGSVAPTSLGGSRRFTIIDGVGTVVTVSTQSELIAAIATGNTINLSNDIYLTSSGIVANANTAIIIRGVTGLILNGNGFKLGGENSVRCLYVGDESEVSFLNLYITGQFQKANGGGLSIQSSSKVTMTACSISGNTAQ